MFAGGAGAMIPLATSPNGSKPPLWGELVMRPASILVVLFLLLGLAAVVWRAKARADTARAQTRIEALAHGAALESQFNQALTAAEMLGALARQSGGALTNFQKIAAELLAPHPSLATLELQPGGVVSDIVPRAGRERLIGFNVLKDPAQSPGAYAAIQRRALTVAGPLALDHGEPGIVVRVPVFQRGRDGRDYFWGFVAVSMRLAEALARARVDELPARGYDYVFFAPVAAPKKPVAIAAHGTLPFQDAVQQTVRAQNLEFRLALRPRAGWFSVTRLVLGFLGVVAVCGVLWLFVIRSEGGRLAHVAGGTNPALGDRGAEKGRPAATQGELRLAEAQALVEKVRNANEAKEIAQAKLKQAESRANELQIQLDSTIRTAAEAAHAKQTEIELAHLALQQAQRATNELQARLEAAVSAERKAVATAQARHEEDQGTIADLKKRLDAAQRAEKEAAETSAARLKQLEESNQELKERLLAAEQMETQVRELTSHLEEAKARLQRLQTDAAQKAGVRAGEPTAQGSSEIEVGKATSAGPNPANGVSPSETSVNVEGARLEPGPLGEESAHLPAPLAPEASPRAARSPKRNSSAAPSSKEMQAEAAVPAAPEVLATKRPGRLAKRGRSRDANQIDLFEGGPQSRNTTSNAAASASADISAAVSASPHELAPADSAALKQVAAQPRPSERAGSESHSEDRGANAGSETAAGSSAPDLTAVEGLAAADGLARVDGDSKLYFKALQQFVQEKAGAPDTIRGALLRGDLAAAGQMVQALHTSATEIGATAVQGSATALARAIREQPDPAEIESLWQELEKAVRALVADLKPLLKPKEGKAGPAHRPPAPPPVNPAKFRKAVNEILPLLTDQDPGAKDCLKANRATFRSAFSTEAFTEFEQFIKESDPGAALEQLRKAAKKHGVSV